MSIAEIFLLAWSCGATFLAVRYREACFRAIRSHKETAVLLAEVVNGEVTPIKDSEGYWVVENDSMKMTFKKMGR